MGLEIVDRGGFVSLLSERGSLAVSLPSFKARGYVMVALSREPYEGSSLVISLTFKDGQGNRYVPEAVDFTLVAQSSETFAWKVVNSLDRVPLNPSTDVDVILRPEDVFLAEGLTRVRQVLVRWAHSVAGSLIEELDIVRFSVQEAPVIEVIPPEPETDDIPEEYSSEEEMLAEDSPTE